MITSVLKIAFFTKMEFIQSNVYPDLYLIKNPIKDTDSMHRMIKKMVLTKVNTEFLDKHRINELSENKMNTPLYRIRFYEYYSGTFFLIPFGEAGTDHFIENKEDPGGFISEELSHYHQYRISEFLIEYCENDSLNSIGKLHYYKGWDIIKTDTLLNQCNSHPQKELSEFAETVLDSN
ncbi:hypothetical protein ACFO3O_19350 [Dokdonia ponticola]|uniref:Uncharacterized protein n=1 Tax=Dokdonia ponticola TaxID=2041041 RepID=A0ABV9I1V3_9FLAO